MTPDRFSLLIMTSPNYEADIAELNERASSHISTLLTALQKACLERDMALAALRIAESKLHNQPP